MGRLRFTTGMPVSDMPVSEFMRCLPGRWYGLGTTVIPNTYSCPDVRTELTETIYTVGRRQFTDSNHPRTLLGHPLDILRSAGETEVGLAVSDVDVAKDHKLSRHYLRRAEF